LFCHRLSALTTLRGKELVTTWQQHVQQGQTEQVVRELLQVHYDPTYASSMKRNFTSSVAMRVLEADDRSENSLKKIAHQLLSE
jgi:tRNA 2-selenouridine synthase